MGTTRIIFLEGRKTILRPLHTSDAPVLVRWMNDPEVRRFISRITPVSEGAEKAWMESLDRRTEDIVLMVETKEGVPIGVMGIHKIHWQNRTATTGAALGEKTYWGKGFGQDAKMALLRYAFHTLNLRKICSVCYAFNHRSAAYNLKCGYRIEGRRRKQAYRNGKYHDEILLAIFREWFDRKWKKYQRTGKL